MNEFQKRFKNFDNRKLLRIIEEAKKYHPDALAAAKSELANRKVSEAEIQSVKDEFSDKADKVEKRKAHVEQLETKASAMGNEFIETINPIQKEPLNVGRKINLFVITFGVIGAYQIFSEFSLLKYCLLEGDEWDASIYYFVLPVIMLPIAVILFAMRLKIGWILLSAYLTYNLVTAIGSYFVYTFITIGAIIISILFYGAALWVICKEDIRDAFQLNKQTAIITIGVSMWLSIVLMAFL